MYSNGGTISSAIDVYICCAVGMHFGESQWKQNVTFTLKTVCLLEDFFFFYKLTLNVS